MEYNMRTEPVAHKHMFLPHYMHEHIMVVISPYGMANCVFFEDVSDSIYVWNVYIKNSEQKKGHGREIMKCIRESYPNHHIWIETWESSRNFWEKMMAEGFIDEIRNNGPSDAPGYKVANVGNPYYYKGHITTNSS